VRRLLHVANGLPQIGHANFSLGLNSIPLGSPVGLCSFDSLAVNPGAPT